MGDCSLESLYPASGLPDAKPENVVSVRYAVSWRILRARLPGCS